MVLPSVQTLNTRVNSASAGTPLSLFDLKTLPLLERGNAAINVNEFHYFFTLHSSLSSFLLAARARMIVISNHRNKGDGAVDACRDLMMTIAQGGEGQMEEVPRESGERWLHFFHSSLVFSHSFNH